MLFFFNGVVGLIFAGTIYLIKKAYAEKSYSKMMLFVLAGIIAFSIATITKNEWKIQVKENALAQIKQEQEVAPTKEKFNPFEETNTSPQNIPLAKIPDTPPVAITKKLPVNPELFESNEHKFRINIPKGWRFVQPDPPHKDIMFTAASKVNFDEMIVTVIQSKNRASTDTFRSAGQGGRKAFIEGMLKSTNLYSSSQGISVQYIDDGYFTLDGEPALWLTIRRSKKNIQQQVFYYFITKNKKIYMISYFCSNEPSRQPQSNLIIDSINSLEFLSS